MRIRTVLGFAVLSIVSLACSGSDHPISPPPPPPPPSAPTITLNPPSTSAMIGDSMTVPAVATNASTCDFGVSGGAEIVVKNGCASVRVAFKSLGTSTITASATGPGGTVNAGPKQITILPRPVVSTLDTLSVSLYSPEESDSPPQGMRARVIWTKSGVKDSVEIAMSGRSATISVPIALDSIHTRFEGDSRYSLREQVLYRGDYLNKQVVIILEPRQWRIRSPQFGGQILSVSIKEGERPNGLLPSGLPEMSPFFKFFKLAKATGGEKKIFPGWSAERLPIRVGIIWAKSAGFSRESDSAHFTDRVFPVLNKYLGKTVFVPGNIPGDTIPDGMVGIVLLDEPVGSGGATGDGYPDATGEIRKGLVTFRNRAGFTPLIEPDVWESRVSGEVHEFMHTLRIGHSCSWISKMTANTSECAGKGSNFLTAMDVAMYEFATAIRDVAKKHNTVFAFN